MEKIINSTEYTDRSLKKKIYELKERYDFLETFSVGQSVMGREIAGIKIGSGEYRLFTAGFSGTERLGTNLLLTFAEEVCACLNNNLPFAGINLNKALKGKGIIIVPRVNPDGTEISLCGPSAAGKLAKEIRRISKNDTEAWRANLRGVEINRNFSPSWESLKAEERKNGIHRPSPYGYGGAFPQSEPETAALMGLCDKFEFKYSISLLGGNSVIGWRYKEKTPQNSEKMASLLASYSGFDFSDRKNELQSGSFKDYFINAFNRPAFNVYIKDQGVHTCQKIYEDLRKMLLVSILL